MSQDLGTTITASKARSNLYRLIEEVSSGLKRFTITHKGEAKVILMNLEEVAAWEETMEIMSDPKLMRDLKRSEKEIEEGKTVSMEKLMKELNVSPDDL